MAYALGLFLADGWLSRQGHSWKISFVNTDEPTVLWWHHFLHNPTRITHRRPEGHLDCWVSTASSDTLGERLLALGLCPRKSWTEAPPPVVPFEHQGAFLRGFFDGDGSIGVRQSGNLEITLTANPLLLRQGLGAMLTAHHIGWREQSIQIRVNGLHAERFCQWIYAVPGPQMDRKILVWRNYQQIRQSMGGLVADKAANRDTYMALAGTMSDVALGHQFQVSPDAIRQLRRKRGILPHPRKKAA